MTTTIEYDLLVQRLMKESEERKMHKVTALTPEQCSAEIAAIQDGAQSIFAEGAIIKTADMTIEIGAKATPEKRKGGWPKGKLRGPRKPK